MVDSTKTPLSSLNVTPSPACVNRNSCVSRPGAPPTVDAENVAGLSIWIRYMSRWLPPPRGSAGSLMLPLVCVSAPAPTGVCAVAGRLPASPASTHVWALMAEEVPSARHGTSKEVRIMLWLWKTGDEGTLQGGSGVACSPFPIGAQAASRH